MQNITPEYRGILCALLSALAIGAGTTGAHSANTVKVGKDTKNTTGVVVALEAGDVACYVTLKDDRGVEFHELADFDICSRESSLVGKRVELTYVVGKVLADECQGNPDCTKSKTVELITAARVLGTAPAQGPNTTRAGQTSFCTPLETVVFACRTGGRLLSVCASKDASPTSGYLQYRFGPPDSADPIELMLPEGEPLPAKSATGENVSYSGGGASWLRFRGGPNDYVVYTGIGKWGPNMSTMTLDGVAVERGGKTVSVLPCTGEVTSELWADWFEKVGITSKGEEFDLPLDWPASSDTGPE